LKHLKLALALAVLIQPLPVCAASDMPLKILAAENVYADIAAQIGGNYVRTGAVLSNPDQDPHVFEASPSVARDIKTADVVILNGAGYDDWMAKLLASSPKTARVVLNAAQITGVKPGENPHLWYDVPRMRVFAAVLTASLSALDPAHQAQFTENLRKFEAELQTLVLQCHDFAAAHPHVPLTASEPVFGYMAAQLGADMNGLAFQLAIMNNTEPAVSDVAAFEKSLKHHEVKAMLYNAQAGSPSVERLKKIAIAAGIPVVPVTETEPAHTSYQNWMRQEISELDKALSGSPQ
jgi:zinc/manganese transport system substrate-binding protein